MANSDGNPFVGPRSLTREDGISGRDTEIRELRWLFTAERIVWLHAPSGAGKTSVVQAGLIPQLLEHNFEVLPIIRVNGKEGENRYEESVVSSLGRKGSKLYDSLTPGSGKTSRALIFDQFEEVLTLDPSDISKKREFFESLGHALELPDVWALFVVRDDFLAALDPYARALPTLMNHRFRLDILSVDNAKRAVEEIAGKGVPARQFTSDALDLLGTRLSEVKVDDGWKQGSFVEPVILQVVCRNMWQGKLPDTIKVAQIPSREDVQKALAQFYASSVKAVSANTSQEADVRDWVEQKLLISGFRNQALDVKDDGAGLGRQVVQDLDAKHHLIHIGNRDGKPYYELQHDRLVAPVLEDNQRWREENLSWLEKRAILWRVDRYKSGLLSEEELKRADQWLDESKADRTKFKDFLDASREEQRDRDRLRRVKWMVLSLAAIMMVAALAITYFILAARSRDWTNQARGEVLDAVGGKDDEAFCKALAHGLRAPNWSRHLDPDLNRSIVEGLAEVLQGGKAFHQIDGAEEGEEILVAHARRAKTDVSPEQDLLAVAGEHAVYLYRPALQTLFRTSGEKCSITHLALSPDGTRIAVALNQWEVVPPQAVPSAESPEQLLACAAQAGTGVKMIAFSPTNSLIVVRNDGVEVGGQHFEDAQVLAFKPDGKAFAIGKMDGTVAVTYEKGIVKDSKGEPIMLEPKVDGKLPPVTSLAWGARGLAAASDESRIIRVWNDKWEAHDYSGGGVSGVGRLAFSPDGSRLAAVGVLADFRAAVWEWGSSTPLVLRPTSKETLKPLTDAVFLDNLQMVVAYQDATIRKYPLDLASIQRAAAETSCKAGK